MFSKNKIFSTTGLVILSLSFLQIYKNNSHSTHEMARSIASTLFVKSSNNDGFNSNTPEDPALYATPATLPPSATSVGITGLYPTNTNPDQSTADVLNYVNIERTFLAAQTEDKRLRFEEETAVASVNFYSSPETANGAALIDARANVENAELNRANALIRNLTMLTTLQTSGSLTLTQKCKSDRMISYIQNKYSKVYTYAVPNYALTNQSPTTYSTLNMAAVQTEDPAIETQFNSDIAYCNSLAGIKPNQNNGSADGSNIGI